MHSSELSPRLRFLDFSPLVAEGNCAIEDKFAFFAVGVGAEIAEAFELETG